MSEYDVDCEPKRILRKLQPGELLPNYSMEVLLRGVCHVVRLSDADAKARIARNRGVDRARIARQKRRDVDSVKRFALVKKMLEVHNTALEIAVALDITVKSAQRYVTRSAELTKLAEANPRYVMKDKNTVRRFQEQEANIRKALKTDAFWSVAARFGFGQKTLKRHLGMS